MKNIGLKSYSVWAKLNLEISINVRAENLDEAVELSKKLIETDFVDVIGEYADGEMKITGVMEDS